MCVNSGSRGTLVKGMRFQLRRAERFEHHPVGVPTSDQVRSCGSLYATSRDPVRLSAVDRGAKRGARLGKPSSIKDAHAVD